MRAPVLETLQGKETSEIHRFELAGLGKAPFTYTGMDQSDGSSCDYCGTGIVYQFWCKSADGKAFKVGCDCIHKHGGYGLVTLISKDERKLRYLKNQAAKARKIARKRERLDVAKSKLESIKGKLSSMPHPNSYFASQGKTMLDFATWCLDMAPDRFCAIVESNS